MRQLENLDRMLGVLERLAPEAARRYHLVVLSDHGQSQGPTFRQRWGETLGEVVDRYAAADAPTAPVFVEDQPDPPVPPLLVVASGNLALLYLTRIPGQVDRDRIDLEYPRLLPGLTAHPGIGLVVVRDAGGPVAIGTAGTHHLADGRVDGVDPLLPYGPHARADLLRHQEAAHVGDIVLISVVDPNTGEVSAFEELVGSHGGLGGWQTEAVLVHPAGWRVTEPELHGPDAVHHQLVEWLSVLGLRAGPAEAPTSPAALPVGQPAEAYHGAAARLSPVRDG
jgi:hypothetical protein